MSAPVSTTGQVVQSWGLTTDHINGRHSGWVTMAGVGGTPVPPSTFPGNIGNAVLDREEIRQEDGRWTYTRWYSAPTAAGSDVEYTLDCSLSTEPITTHPKFAQIVADPANGAQFDPATGEFRCFAKYPAEGTAVSNPQWVGVTDYLAPGVVWRETTRNARGGDAPSLAMIGKIDTPAGPCPAAPGGCNWLFMGYSKRVYGGVVQYNREWRLSGPAGWNPVLYSA